MKGKQNHNVALNTHHLGIAVAKEASSTLGFKLL